MNSEEKSLKIQTPHIINIQNRENMVLNGVEDVVNFDEFSILMQTVSGVLSVDGIGLHIVKLNVDSGEVIIEGEINGMFYIDESAEPAGNKLFRKKRK
jgi:YabP family.